jgi:hypothetical protein
VSSFAPSTRYESYITSLKQRWMGKNGKRIFGGFAAALGDRTVDWLTQGLLEHLPGYANDATSIALIGNERQVDTYPGEPTTQLAAREPQWMVLGKFVGTPLGILLGMHFCGFDGAVVVQQNGNAYQLTLPLPTFTAGVVWDPTPNLVITPCSQLAVGLTSSVTPPTSTTGGRRIPSGNAWWVFDSNTDLCSRFAVLFPSPPEPMLQSVTGRATFAAVDAAAVAWSSPIATPAGSSISSDLPSSASYFPVVGPPIVTDGSGPVVVNADLSTATSTGVTLRATEPFGGYVDASVIGLAATDLQRLQATIKKWRGGKATCTGVYVCLQGKFMGWPVQTEATNTFGSHFIVRYAGA